jgi:hypothetical protein
MKEASKKASAKRGAGAAAAKGAAPVDLWAAKGVAINLSQSRREALKVFAESCGPGATPAQALYALIDLIKPAAQSQAAADISAESGQPDAGSTHEEHFSLLAQRLSAIEADAGDTKRALSSCADALDEIANAMAPIRDLISTMSSERATALPISASSEPAPAAGAIDLKSWLPAVIDIIGVSPREELAFHLRLAERPNMSGTRARIVLNARLASVDKRLCDAARPSLPSISLLVEAGGALAVCLSVEPRADLGLVFTRARTEGWQASIKLKAASGAYGRTLFEDAP